MQPQQNYSLYTSSPLSRLAPLVLIGLLVAASIALLLIPIKMPIGAMYWDLFIYLDGAQRIYTGDTPMVDFFAPVGPLGYYLAAAGLNLFPNGQPLLVVSWSIMVITVPLMALIAYDASKKSPLAALAITIPFVIFSFLPFNTTISYTFPGSDGFAIYNRQTSQLLYVVVAAVLFQRTQWLLALVIGVVMTALFFTKITGFVAAGLVCLIALLSGRIKLTATGGAIVIFVVIVGLAELTLQGIVSSYLYDIGTLLTMNQGGLLLRMVQAASKTAGTTFSTAILGLILFIATWPAIRAALKDRDFKQVVDHPSVWLAAVLFAGLVFESQNTGGQELVFLWPVIVMIVAALQIPGPRPVTTGVTLVVAACVVLPATISTIQSSLRSTIGGLKQQALQHTHLRQMGNVTIRPEMKEQADTLLKIYRENPNFEDVFAETKKLPSFILFAEFDFQWLFHVTADEVVGALKSLEDEGLDYDTVLTVNFSNPFAWLLDKRAPKHIAIGADPNRTVPTPDAETIKAVSETDIVLIPLCPTLYNSLQLLELYQQPLANHKRVSITQCYDALVHPGIEFKF